MIRSYRECGVNENIRSSGRLFVKRKSFLKKKTECVVKTHDRSETFVLEGNIVIIHQSLLNSIFTTKLYILMKKINYKQR
jgi:hypothetical protein